MNDILASIRRVLNEEETVSNPQSPAPSAPSGSQSTPPGGGAAPSPGKSGSDDVFLLDQSMLTTGAASPAPAASSQANPGPAGPGSGSVYETMAHAGSAYAPAAAPGGMVAPSAMAAAASSVGQLVRQVSQRAPASARDGTLVEELVRDAVQPMLKEWLDRNLPPLVERLVQAEIRKMMNQAMAEA